MSYPNITGTELEWLWLTLNTFQMQFLFQMNCFSYVWHHYNWHHVIGNRFLVNSLIILVNSFFHMSCYSQTSVNFLRTKNICWQKIIGVVIVNVAYYLKKEHHKYNLFPFGITFPLLPESDRKEIQYNIALKFLETKHKIDK